MGVTNFCVSSQAHDNYIDFDIPFPILDICGHSGEQECKTMGPMEKLCRPNASLTDYIDKACSIYLFKW